MQLRHPDPQRFRSQRVKQNLRIQSLLERKRRLGGVTGGFRATLGFEPEALPSPHPSNQVPQINRIRVRLKFGWRDSRIVLSGPNDRERIRIEVDDPARDSQDFFFVDCPDLLGKRAVGVGS